MLLQMTEALTGTLQQSLQLGEAERAAPVAVKLVEELPCVCPGLGLIHRGRVAHGKDGAVRAFDAQTLVGDERPEHSVLPILTSG